MNNKEVDYNKINEYLDRKGFGDTLVRNIVSKFMIKHTENFGHIISQDELISRLDENLDKVVFDKNRVHSKSGEAGLYEGRVGTTLEDVEEKNQITLFFDRDALEFDDLDKMFLRQYRDKNVPKEKWERTLVQKLENRENVQFTLMHELVHAAYTIKESDGISETQNFATIGKNIFGLDQRSFIGGESAYLEPITNYISTKLLGEDIRETHSYKASGYREETDAMYKLEEKIGVEAIIGSAWNSDLHQFEQSFNSIGQDAYKDFTRTIKDIELDQKRYDGTKEFFPKMQERKQQVDRVLSGNPIYIDKPLFKELKKESLEKVDEVEVKSDENIENTQEEKHRKTFKDIIKGFWNRIRLKKQPMLPQGSDANSQIDSLKKMNSKFEDFLSQNGALKGIDRDVAKKTGFVNENGEIVPKSEKENREFRAEDGNRV